MKLTNKILYIYSLSKIKVVPSSSYSSSNLTLKPTAINIWFKDSLVILVAFLIYDFESKTFEYLANINYKFNFKNILKESVSVFKENIKMLHTEDFPRFYKWRTLE